MAVGIQSIIKKVNRSTCYFALVKITMVMLLSVWSLTTNAQCLIKGTIYDKETKQPISFAAIVPNNYPQYGTVSDIDGNYKITIPKDAEKVHIKHINYGTTDFTIVELKEHSDIYLKSTIFEINEVNVTAKENPAHRLIRNAVKNKEFNNPDEYDYYSCNIYHKTTGGPYLDDTVTIDSTNRRLKTIADSIYLFLMETQSKKYYEKNKGSKEIVEAIRTSGFKKPEFFLSNNEIQPFHFYDEYINLYETLFLSPITNQGIGKYYYEIVDTIIQQTDTIFSIFYRPYKNKVFNGLTGQLQINTNGYAIQNIYAKPAGHHLMKISVHQQYQYAQGRWFPEKVDYDIVIQLPQFPGGYINLSGRSVMDSVVFTHAQRAGIPIDNVAYNLMPNAYDSDSTFWETIRPASLSLKEQNTYIIIDSVFEEKKVEQKMKWAFRFARTKKLPLKYLSIDYNNVYNYNQHEGFQLGIGLYTNDDIAKWLELGGYFRYGFTDHRYKYGANVTLEFNREKQFDLGGGFKNDLKEPGFNNFDQLGPKIFSRSLVMNRADSIIDRFAFIQRQFGKWLFRLQGNIQNIAPLYPYNFLPDSGATLYKNQQIGLHIKWAPNERINYIFGYPFAIFDYPVINLQYIYGFKNKDHEGFYFHKLLFSAIQEFEITGWGVSKIHIKAGYIKGDVPLFRLIEGEGSYDDNLPFIFNGYYQVVKPGEFFHNRYVGIFYSHNFGPVFRITEKIKPELIIAQNMGYGKLNNADSHQYVELNDMHKGYFESGIVLNNLYRHNLYNMIYAGVGFGTYYRYGDYAYAKEISNFAFKLSLIFDW